MTKQVRERIQQKLDFSMNLVAEQLRTPKTSMSRIFFRKLGTQVTQKM
jgi:hypothetical protein